MANLEQQVKALLSNREKREVIAKDEAFLNAVSSGTATPEKIAEKFDIPFSPKESEMFKKTVAELLKKSPKELEKLGDDSLKTISGGVSLMGASTVVTAGGAIGGLGCFTASMVCRVQAKKTNDQAQKDQWLKAAKGLEIAAEASAGVTAAGIAGLVVGARHKKVLKPGQFGYGRE